MLSENLGLKLISLLIAILIWVQSLLIMEHRSTVNMPVVLKNIPNNITLEKLPQSIPFTVRGRGLEIFKLKLSRTKVYVDAAKIKPGNDILNLSDYSIDLPENIKLTLIGPVEKHDLAIQSDVFHQKKVPVVLSFADTYTRQRFSNLNYKIEPENLVIFGPKKKVQLLEQITVEPISREMLAEKELTLKISEPGDDVSTSEKQVKIRISTSYNTTKVFDGIPIHAPDNLKSLPSRITLKLSGDSELLDRINLDQLKASIGTTPDAQGFYPVKVDVPANTSVVAITPNKVRVR